MCSLGWGVLLNEQEAVKWYQMAAEQKLDWAQAWMGWAYANGEGVPENYTDAYAWANLSAAQGNVDATELKNRLRLMMTRFSLHIPAVSTHRCLYSNCPTQP